MKFDKQVTKAELAVEKGQIAKALEILDSVILESIQKKSFDDTINALGHKLVIWLHHFQNTGDAAYLELMAADARAGFAIGTQNKADKNLLANMLLRLGQYHYYRQEFKEAATMIKPALSMIHKNETGRVAEFTSFYAIAAALAGDKHGAKLLTDCLHQVQKSKDLRPFHKMVVESGILLRIAVLAANQNDMALCVSAIAEAKKIAAVLADKYKMSQRLSQTKKVLANPQQPF